MTLTSGAALWSMLTSASPRVSRTSFESCRMAATSAGSPTASRVTLATVAPVVGLIMDVPRTYVESSFSTRPISRDRISPSRRAISQPDAWSMRASAGRCIKRSTSAIRSCGTTLTNRELLSSRVRAYSSVPSRIVSPVRFSKSAMRTQSRSWKSSGAGPFGQKETAAITAIPRPAAAAAHGTHWRAAVAGGTNGASSRWARPLFHQTSISERNA